MFTQYLRIFMCQTFLRTYPKIYSGYTHMTIRDDNKNDKCQKIIQSSLASAYNNHKTQTQKYILPCTQMTKKKYNDILL
jgi:hypothetical protein